MPSTRDTALADLTHAKAAKRAAAAHALRRLGQPGDDIALRDALQRELHGRKSWEVLVRLCLALASLDDGSGLDLLRSVGASSRDATGVNMAAAFALTHVADRTGESGSAVLVGLVEDAFADEALAGALMALAELGREVPDHVQAALVKRATAAFAISPAHPLVGALLRAAHAGGSEELRRFVEEWTQSTDRHLREVAEAAVRGERPTGTM